MQHEGPQRPAAYLLCLLLALPAAAETVTLRNGFRLRVQSHERAQDGVRLLTANGGWISVAAAEVARIDSDTSRDGADPQRPTHSPEASRAPDLADEVALQSARAGLPAGLVRAVIHAESGFRQDAVSPKGAIGLMQLMPATAAEFGVDPHDASGNLEGGARYLKQLLVRFDGDRDQLVKALAAYNAGPGSVDLHGGLPPYPETVAYVARVLERYVESEPTEPAGTGE